MSLPQITTPPAAPGLDLPRLQSELARLVKALHDDLRQRCDEQAAVNAPLQAEYEEARRAERTSESFTAWRETYLNQVAVAWVLATLFLRYLEDNGMLDEVWLSGPGGRRNEAQERYTAYFRAHPEHSDREYFHHVFDQLARLPGCGDLYGRQRTPLWKVGLSGDGAKRLRAFWWDIDPNRGAWSLEAVDSRFLGDLYQNLSEEARSRFALLQTPDFVESFILDRTLEPAIREFGLEQVRIIDPTCGSGHFLLGAFQRLLGHWQARSSDNPRALARKALEAVHGIDINPFAVAIARFRLLLAFLKACGFSRLKDMPDIHPRVATGDSLLFGRSRDRENNTSLLDWLPEPFATGDYDEACQILSQHYHAVVGNPPYITDKDKRHNEVVRSRYYSCHRQYSLGVPFTERFFDLAVDGTRAGYVGMITTNSFMKREFGKKLIEEVLPRLDLTHVLDTSGAYIPGHGTPTVILLGRHRPPVGPSVRAVLGIRGEPTTPDVPAEGLVWSSIVQLVDGRHGDQNAFVSVADVPRTTFAKHPWSIGGGGASELKEQLENVAKRTLGKLAESIGFHCITKMDEVYLLDARTAARKGISSTAIRDFGTGEAVRDWAHVEDCVSIFPYDESIITLPIDRLAKEVFRYLWRFKTTLGNRKVFGGESYFEAGKPWWEYGQIPPDKLRTPLSIAFAFVATHNHFVLDRGGKVFNRSAPIIKLPEGSSEEQHLALLGLLNSSVACFWLKQVCHNKGTASDTGVLQGDPERFRYEFDGTKLGNFPLPEMTTTQRQLLTNLARSLDHGGQELNADWQAFISQNVAGGRRHLEAALATFCDRREQTRQRMVRWQEELDWLCYEIYGLLPADQGLKSLVYTSQPGDMPLLAPELRPYRWLERTETPDSWLNIDTNRRTAIQSDGTLGLLERPDYKRRWFRSAGAYNAENLDDKMLIQEALQNWLLDRIEARVQAEPRLISASQLADRLGREADFLAVLALYKGRDDSHLVSEVTQLVLGQGVPYLAAYRYSESGLRVRAEWERCWALQRRQDAGEPVNIAVPPKYSNKDFRQPGYWGLRGKLDVPKERFILYPGLEREADPSPVLGWAGWNHLQRAQALVGYLLERKDNDGWGVERLQPMLAGLAELLPWLKQWHNDIDPETDERPGDTFETFVRDEARALGLTMEQLASWLPPEGSTRKGRGKKA